jgi:hypothetical protein
MKQLVGLEHASPPSAPIVGKIKPRFGAATIVQLVPFHRSTSVNVSPDESEVLVPAARQAVAVTQASAVRTAICPDDGFGVVMTDHVVPFHRSASVFIAPLPA